MTEIVDALGVAQLVVYVALAVVSARRWLADRGRARAWAALTFLVLAVVAAVGRTLPEDGDGWTWAQKVLVATLALFPYLLYRFAATFERPPPWMERAAAALTAAAAGGIFLFRDLPDAGEDRSAAFQAYALLVLLQWGVLTGFVVWRLWRAGTGRPTVARYRMRLLSLGAATITGALAVAATAPPSDEPGVAQVVAGVAALAAGPLFAIGLAPPAILLALWRRPEQARMRQAGQDLTAAVEPSDVAAALLPHVVAVVGGRGAVLADGSDAILAREALSEDEAAEVLQTARDGGSVLAAPVGEGRLVVATDAYTPYFGRDEAEVMHELASLTEVALRRAEVTARERAAADELVRAAETMRDFVAIASHELRTPITVVRGFAQVLRQGWETFGDADKLEYIDIIERHGDQLSRLVDDLLVVSRIDADVIEPDAEPLVVSEVVAQCLRDLGRADVVTIAGQTDASVHADKSHLYRVVRNLVENAFHYGEPPVSIDIAANDGMVELRVVDGGEGVPDELLPRLFERFARADKAKSRSQHGTGLGLSIVRGLARAGGGEAWYERVNGQGACFAVRLPAHQEEQL